MIEFPLAVEYEQDEKGFITATVPSLPGCVVGADNWDTLYENLKDAVSTTFEDDYQQRKTIALNPEPETLLEKVTNFFKPKHKVNKMFGFITLLMKTDAELDDPRNPSKVDPRQQTIHFTIG